MKATTDVAVQCRCGAVRGVAAVSPSTGNHAVCYCDDCQAFQHFLGREQDVLDSQGGTDIFQMSPVKLTLSAGAERLACIRLTPKGLLRWYTSCCNTPIGNTRGAGVPFIGLVCACLHGPAAALGPIRARAFPESAKGGASAVPKDGAPLLLILARVLGFIVRWRLRGDHRRSPLFDSATGAPRAVPRIVTAAQREDLRRRCASWRAAS